MNEEQMLVWIKTGRPYDLLFRWRFGASTDKIFHGAVGEAFKERICKLRDEELTSAEWTTLSKAVGWKGE